METSDVFLIELWFHTEKEYFFSQALCLNICLFVFSTLSLLQVVVSLSEVPLTAHDSWHNKRLCVPVCVFLLRGAVEPFVVRRSQDDNHPGRLIHSDQHCDHPSLWLEQLHFRRRPQAEVPLLPRAEEHQRLSEVNHLMITLDTSTLLWTFDAVTSNLRWAHPALILQIVLILFEIRIKRSCFTTDTWNRIWIIYFLLQLVPVLSVLKSLLFQSLLVKDDVIIPAFLFWLLALKTLLGAQTLIRDS